MSAALIDPDPSIQQLLDEGYELEVVHQHLLVHSIPYVNASGLIRQGTLAAPYTGTRQPGVTARPRNHTAWFRGEMPHHGTALQPMTQLVNNSKGNTLFEGFTAQHYFSNKPNDTQPHDFYELVSHYHTLLRAEAQIIDPNADGRTGRVRENRDPGSVFVYPDTASCRAGITELSQRLDRYSVAIVGVGGTGSYVLDMISKTSVFEIHLYDGDHFEAHNAFRSPGIATLEEVNLGENKAVFFQRRYAGLRRSIFAHPYRIAADNLAELNKFDFIFICIDNGQFRKLICEYLAAKGISFIDTGIGMLLNDIDGKKSQLSATVRVTVSTRDKSDHLGRCLDYAADDDDIYGSNIQVVEINALNAAMAVYRWKQEVGVYLDMERPHDLTMSTSLQSLHRGECLEVSCEE